MSDIKALREQRANIWSQMTEVMDRPKADGGAMKAEDAQTYDRLEADLDRLEGDIVRAEKHDQRGTAYDQVDRRGVIAPADVDEPEDNDIYAEAFKSYILNDMGSLSQEHRQALAAGQASIKNAAGVGTTTAGGYAVPPLFRDTFVETMKWYGPMLDVAEVIRTDSGASLPWPTNDDTANVGAILAENTQVTEQDVTLGTASLDVYMYTSKLVRVSLQLLNDRPDWDTWLARKLGERVGRILNQHFTTGTGTAQPLGVATGATTGVTGTGSFATTGGISYDNLVDLVESLDPAYGNGSGLQFMAHQSVRKALRKLKDSQNRPLWEPSLQTGTADSLLGYQVVLNNDLAALAQSSKSLLFGDFRQAYVVRIVNDLSTLRLNERYADFLQVGFLAFERAGGTVQNANALRAFTTTATA